MVQTTLGCSEGVSGPRIASCPDSNGDASPPHATLNPSTTGPHTCTITATSSDGQAATKSIAYTVAGAPSARIESAANDAKFVRGRREAGRPPRAGSVRILRAQASFIASVAGFFGTSDPAPGISRARGDRLCEEAFSVLERGHSRAPAPCTVEQR